jgi:hypothetical protein
LNKILLIALFFASGFVLLGSFLPWLTFKTSLPTEFTADFKEAKAFMDHFLTLTGWNGEVTLLGITLPNWMVPIAAIFVALTTAGRATGTWDAPRKLSIGLAVFCTIHLGTLLFVAAANSESTRLGFGAILGMFGSLGMLGLTIFLREDEEVDLSYVREGQQNYGQQAYSPQGVGGPGYPQPPMQTPQMPQMPMPGMPAMDEAESEQPAEAQNLPPTGRVDPYMD